MHWPVLVNWASKIIRDALPHGSGTTYSDLCYWIDTLRKMGYHNPHYPSQEMPTPFPRRWWKWGN